MIGSGAGTAAKTRIRLIVAILVAVVSSMTLHHGAMARSDGMPIAPVGAHHQIDSSCTDGCGTDRHSMPVCCGMGLCLSGMPVAPIATLPVERTSDIFSEPTEFRPCWVFVRIDRPPKAFLEVA